MTELSDAAQTLYAHIMDKGAADERVLYGGGNPNAEPQKDLVDSAIAQLKAAGLNLAVSRGDSRRMIRLVKTDG